MKADPAKIREQFRKEIPCPTCEGSGFTFGPEDKECKSCSGSGHRRLDAH